VKKDIEIRKVTEVGIAIIPPSAGSAENALWDVYLINQKGISLKNIIISIRGFGEREGEKVQTSTFRFFYEEIPPLSSVKIETIQTELFDLAHEFLISFSEDNYLFDKRFVFVKGSICAENFTFVALLEQQGVLII
jgi:hypothetical protein